MTKALAIRDARTGDEETILEFLRAFAEFEKLAHTFHLTKEIVARDFLGPRARVYCDLAEWEGKAAAIAIWFRTYGTFAAAPIVHLEDIYVAPEFRRRGIATALIKHLARRASDENALRLEWTVLNWNTGAIDFYSRIGARLESEWRIGRLSGDPLADMAKS